MTLKAFDLPRQSIEAPSQCGFHPFGIIRRQIGRKRRLYDKRLWHALAVGVVGELTGQLRWQAEWVLGPHQIMSEINAIPGIHGRLARHAGYLPAQSTGTLHAIVRLFVGERELGDWRGSFGC